MPYFGQRSSLGPSFVYIEPSIHIHIAKPSGDNASESTVNAEAPDLVLLFPQTGADSTILQTHINRYVQCFPWTPIMVVTTSAADVLYRTPQRIRKALKPAVDLLKSFRNPFGSTRVFAHCFHSSGFDKLSHLASAHLVHTGRQLPLCATILDNTLGEDLISPTSAARPPLWDLSIPRSYVFSQATPRLKHEITLKYASAAKTYGANTVLVPLRSKERLPLAEEDEAIYDAAVRYTWQRSVGRDREGQGLEHDQ